MPSHEHGAVVVDASARTPSPTPSTPAPRIVGGDQPSDSDSDPERYERHSHRNGGAHVDYRGVVHWHIHHLRIRWLNHVRGRARCLLHLHILLLVGLQVSGAIGLAPQTLDGRGDRPRISRKCLSDCGIVINIVGHHRNDPGEGAQRQECRIEALFLRGIGERWTGQAGIRGKPVVEVQDLLRIGRRGCDLSQQRVGIQSHRREQLVELRWCGHRSRRCGLRHCHRRAKSRREAWNKKKAYEKPNSCLTRLTLHG